MSEDLTPDPESMGELVEKMLRPMPWPKPKEKGSNGNKSTAPQSGDEDGNAIREDSPDTSKQKPKSSD